MALAMEGFSIREYTSRMRSVDVAKCWPFDEANEEDVRAVLPPIAIKKFRWWFDEIELVDGNNNIIDDEDDDEEEVSDLESETLECLRMKNVQKGKSAKVKGVNWKKAAKPKAKAPKKRSIVELFAVAPQVERVNSEDDDENGEYSDEEEDGDGDSGQEDDLSCKSKRKVKKKGILSMLKKENMVLIKKLKNKDEGKKKKKKEKGKKIAVDLKSPKKDKTSKVKLQTSVDCIANSNCSSYSKDLFEAIATHLKKPRLKRLTTEKMKCTNMSTSKLLPKGEQEVFPVRGILKNHMKTFQEENSTDSILHTANKLTDSTTQHVNKHVTFSGRDDVLEPRRKTHPTMELELQKFCDSASDISCASLGKHNTSERGKSLSILEMKEIEDDIPNYTADDVEVQCATETQLSGRYHVADAPKFFLRDHVFGQGNLLNTSVSYGQGPLHIESPQWFEECNRFTSRDALYTCSSSGSPSMSQERNIPKLTIPMFGYLSDASSSSQRLLDFSGDAGPELDLDCSVDYLKAYPQPPSSYPPVVRENANTRPLFPSQNMRENHNEHAFSCQWFPHLSPKELMRTICSLPDWNSRMAMRGETSANENFIGLPLNSQGEFISLDSSGKEEFNHLRSKSSLRDSSLNSPMHNNIFSNSVVNHADIRSWNGMRPCTNQLQSCRIKYSGENFALPSREDMIEHYGFGRRNTVIQGSDPYFYPLESDMDRMKMSHFESRHNEQVEKHPGDDIFRQHYNPDQISLHAARSTMRLMGQEFTVGGRVLEGLEDRELWTDKQIITERPGNNATEASSIKRPNMPAFIMHPILGKLKGTVTHLSKAKIKQASEDAPLMMVPESKTSSLFFDHHNNAMQQHGDGTSKAMLIPERYPQFSLVSSPFSERHKPILQNQFSCAYKSPIETPRISIPASTVLDYSHNEIRSGTRLENKHTPVHAAQLAFKVPFSHSEHGRHIHPSWSQNSFKVIPPRLLESRQRGSLMGYHQSHSGPVYDPCSVSGFNFQTDPSVFPQPEPCYSFASSGSENPFASASLAHCPSVPVHPGFSPNSSMQNRHGETMKSDNQIKSGFSVRIPTYGKRTKKRFPLASDDSMKSSKMPKLGIQEDYSCAVTAIQTSNNFDADTQCDRLVIESGSAEKNAETVECGQNGVRADELGDCTAMDSFKLAGATRSGPMKLTAGARYILKPCQKNDQVNSKSTNSTIPVAASTTDRRVLGSEKSSKIYRF